MLLLLLAAQPVLQDGCITDELQKNEDLSSIEQLLRLRARRRSTSLACIAWGDAPPRLMSADKMSAWVAQLQQADVRELRAAGPMAIQSYTQPADNARYVATYSEENHNK